jgi:hypothetical protein
MKEDSKPDSFSLSELNEDDKPHGVEILKKMVNHMKKKVTSLLTHIGNGYRTRHLFSG